MTVRKREQGPLARQLEWLRWREHLTRDALAESAGVSPDLVQSLEQGRASNPTLNTLIRLARALNVSVAELIAEAANAPAE
jgi:transcriptional regulator with XRE-family HTH domain